MAMDPDRPLDIPRATLGISRCLRGETVRFERLFVYQPWRALCRDGLTAVGLVDFHTRHKFNRLAHDEPAYRAPGRRTPGRVMLERWDGTTPHPDDGLKKPAHAGSHANVLQHLYGYVKECLDVWIPAFVEMTIKSLFRGPLDPNFPRRAGAPRRLEYLQASAHSVGCIEGEGRRPRAAPGSGYSRRRVL